MHHHFQMLNDIFKAKRQTTKWFIRAYHFILNLLRAYIVNCLRYRTLLVVEKYVSQKQRTYCFLLVEQYMHINLWQKACTHNFYILTFFLLTLIVDRNNEKVHSLSRKGVSSINDVQHLAPKWYMTYFLLSFLFIITLFLFFNENL